MDEGCKVRKLKLYEVGTTAHSFLYDKLESWLFITHSCPIRVLILSLDITQVLLKLVVFIGPTTGTSKQSTSIYDHYIGLEIFSFNEQLRLTSMMLISTSFIILVEVQKLEESKMKYFLLFDPQKTKRL